MIWTFAIKSVACHQDHYSVTISSVISSDIIWYHHYTVTISYYYSLWHWKIFLLQLLTVYKAYLIKPFIPFYSSIFLLQLLTVYKAYLIKPFIPFYCLLRPIWGNPHIRWLQMHTMKTLEIIIFFWIIEFLFLSLGLSHLH